MRKIKAVLFDLDGVLVETRKLHFEALSLALNEIQKDLSYEVHQNLYDGLPTFKKIELLTAHFNLSPDEVSFLNLRKQEHTVKLLEGSISPKQELMDILNYLKQNMINIAICSNTKRHTLDYIIEKLEIEDIISFSLSNEDVDSPKPSPEIYLKAMERLNILPSEALIFEDSPHGLEAAKKSQAKLQAVSCPEDLTLELVKSAIA